MEKGVKNKLNTHRFRVLRETERDKVLECG